MNYLKKTTYLALFIAAASFSARAASLEQTNDSTKNEPGAQINTVQATDSSQKPIAAQHPIDSGEKANEKEHRDHDSDFGCHMRRAREAAKFLDDCAEGFTRRGFGIGGGPQEGLFAIDIRPFSNLAGHLSALRGKQFSFGATRYQPFLMSGGLGYVGIGNGLRLGGGGMGGERHFMSKTYGGDSTLNYSTRVTWGGFLIEKSVCRQSYSYMVGGYIGGGSLEASWTQTNGEYSAFSQPFQDDESKAITASFGYFELHAGVTYSIFRYMHVSGDVSVPLLVSTDGFAPYTSDFVSINPGLRIRLIFGNLG